MKNCPTLILVMFSILMVACNGLSLGSTSTPIPVSMPGTPAPTSSPFNKSAGIWIPVVGTLAGAIIGGLLGGGLTFLANRRQMNQTARIVFISSVMSQYQVAVASVFEALSKEGNELKTFKQRIEDQPWFELLTAQSPKLRKQFLKYLDDGEVSKATNSFRKLLLGEIS